MKEFRLDRSRPYGTVYGYANHRFEQDGLCFDAHGNEILPDTGREQTQPTADVRPTSAQSSSAAVRMRRSRERRRKGVVAIVHLEVTEQDVTALVTRNLLSSETGADRAELCRAIRTALTEILAP
jgi:hypothetical protein